MRTRRLHAVGVAAALVVATVAVAASKRITLELKLPKKSTVAAPVMAPVLTAGPLSLVVVDVRGAEDPEVVGGQRIKGKDVYVWRAEQPVLPAVTTLVAQVLQSWSVRVAPDAELTLRLGLMRYYVNERSDTFGSTYIAEVRFMVSLTDRTGTVLWTGEANGESKRPGVDARASMCNEALSLALSSALAQGLSSVKTDMASPASPPLPPPPTPPTPVAEPTMIEPDALFADLSRLKTGGVADDVLVAYVVQRRLSRPLSVDEILQWKNAGIPDAAIKAATSP